MSPNVTFFDVLGKRIYSIETPDGFVHLCDKLVFEHVSDALRYIKGEQPNPVIAAMDLEAISDELTVTDPVVVEE